MKIRGKRRLAAVVVVVCGLWSCAESGAAKGPSAGAPVKAAAAPRSIGVASFNMAWAGTMDDFRRHLAMCGAPDVKWCETRARVQKGETAPAPEEQARAARCVDATIAAAGGPAAWTLVAPCGAYRGRTQGDASAARTPEAYAAKLAGLRATVERLVEREGISVLAFQEVRSRAVVEEALGKFASTFDVCAAPHTSFQTVAFAWDKAVTEKPGVCSVNDALAIGEAPREAGGVRRVRPGLALELVIGGAPVTFLNVHMKAGCANIVATERYPARLLTDPNENCETFNRQVPILESWIDGVAARTPRFVFLGDLNRRIDEEAAAAIPPSQVRADGSDPAGPNPVDATGKVPTRYLWQEIADGSPALHQVPLSTSEGGCAGFTGLDHVVVSDAVRRANPAVIPSRKVAVEEAAGQRIETSDHCPRLVWLAF